MNTSPIALVALLLLGCPQTATTPQTPDTSPDTSTDTTPDAPDVSPDASPDPRLDASPDASDLRACASLPSAPTAPLLPEPGELYYEQLGLGGFALGEAAIVVAGDGRVVVIDVGNDSHADDVAERLQALGYDTLDDIIITHFHADHGDGLSELLEVIPMRGRLVHRGVHARTPAANEGTLDELIRVAGGAPGRDFPLCDAVGCAGLGGALDHGATRVRFLGADATMDEERYVDVVGPLQTQDSNGENARSVVGVLEHGPFRLLFTGDLTGGGSDTDDVESFYAPRLGAVSDLGVLGVDVLHAGHHGRDTSSNETWVRRVLPDDGRARNVVMGVSTAHLRSPHQEVVDRLGRALTGGAIWTTRVAVGGGRSPELVDADGGSVVIATRDGGARYVVQALDESGRLLSSRVFDSVRGCGQGRTR